MLWAGHVFRFVCLLDPWHDRGGQIALFMPQSRYARATTSRLKAYGAGPFYRFGIPPMSRRAGVYVIGVGGQSTNCKINALVLRTVQAGSTLKLWFAPTPIRKALERRLIQSLRPPWNGPVLSA